MHRCYWALNGIGGIYVIEFPGRVKVGVAGELRQRVRWHIAQGATGAAAFPTRRRDAYDLEALALQRVARLGRQLGESESFTGVTFDVATEITHDVVWQHYGGPVLQVDGMNAHVLTPFPRPNRVRVQGLVTCEDFMRGVSA